jgi:tetratricopeptide (TPR) repeat protein
MSDAARFEAAIALEGHGRWEDAARALESFAREHPEHALAPDALAEAAGLRESRLYQPARALELWTQIETLYPSSRSARRAALRSAELKRALRAGVDEAASFDRIIGEGGVPPRRDARQQMSSFLAAHPHFPLGDRGLVWLGQAAEAAGERDEALARYAEAVSEHGPERASAARARADLLLRLGRLNEAQAAYASLGGLPDPVARLAHDEGLAAVRRAARRRALAQASACVLALFTIVALVLGRRRLLPLALEVRFFAPVAVLFSLISLRKGGMPARAITFMALGSALVLWLAGAARLALRAHSQWIRLALALSTMVAIAAVADLAIYASKLTDFVLQTMQYGPDR